MMATTYEDIASITLTSGQSSVSFNSITSSYTDLVIIVNGSISILDRSIRMRYNEDTGTNYSYGNMTGYSGGAISQSASNTNHTRISAASSTDIPNTYIVHIMNYANTTTYKTHISRGSGAGNNSYVDSFIGSWRSTSAITNILLFPNTGEFNLGTTFNIYGILKA
jgi:hypothetical protein